jgi:hypothetical protein
VRAAGVFPWWTGNNRQKPDFGLFEDNISAANPLMTRGTGEQIPYATEQRIKSADQGGKSAD